MVFVIFFSHKFKNSVIKYLGSIQQVLPDGAPPSSACLCHGVFICRSSAGKLEASTDTSSQHTLATKGCPTATCDLCPVPKHVSHDTN